MGIVAITISQRLAPAMAEWAACSLASDTRLQAVNQLVALQQQHTGNTRVQ